MSEQLLRVKSVRLELEQAREDLAEARSTLEQAQQSHNEQIAKVASFYQRDAAAKARVLMLNACFLQYPNFDWEAVKRHL